MIPAKFDYVRPRDLDETLRILKDREGEAKLLSGGYSLIPLIKLLLEKADGLVLDLPVCVEAVTQCHDLSLEGHDR